MVTKSTEGSWPQTTHNGNLVAVGVLPTVWHRHCAMHTSKSKLHTLHFISATSIASPLLSKGSNSTALVFATCDLRPEKEGDDDCAGCFPISYCLSKREKGASRPCRRGRRDGMTESWRPLSSPLSPSSLSQKQPDATIRLATWKANTNGRRGRQRAEKQPSLVPHICPGVGVRAKSES